jgi:4'-phosphopantetheinyl transferase
MLLNGRVANHNRFTDLRAEPVPYLSVRHACFPVDIMLTSLATTQIPAAEISYALGKDVVHVWRIPVAADAARASDISHLLTPQEHARGGRFRRLEDRLRFELGRAATRRLLARYLGLAPLQVGIDADGSGKPRLSASTPAGERLVHFNLSHSGGWIVVAFARSFAVGIDVEVLRETPVSADLMTYVMSDNEARMVHNLPEDQQNAAFFKCWTSKEAFVKGVGIGLSVALREIEVCIDPQQPARLVSAPPALCPGDWHLRTLGFTESYAGALAVATPSAQVIEILVGGWPDIDGASSAE